MSKKGHFQIACSKYFDTLHNKDLGLAINHPNEFFEESQKIRKGFIKPEIKTEEKVNIKSEEESNMNVDE